VDDADLEFAAFSGIEPGRKLRPTREVALTGTDTFVGEDSHQLDAFALAPSLDRRALRVQANAINLVPIGHRYESTAQTTRWLTSLGVGHQAALSSWASMQTAPGTTLVIRP